MPSYHPSNSSYTSSISLPNSVTFSLSRPTPPASSNSTSTLSTPTSGLPTSVSFLLNPIYHSSGSQSTTPTSPILLPSHSYFRLPSPTSTSTISHTSPRFSNEPFPPYTTLPSQPLSTLKKPSKSPPSPRHLLKRDAVTKPLSLNEPTLNFRKVAETKESYMDCSHFNNSPNFFFSSQLESVFVNSTLPSATSYHSDKDFNSDKVTLQSSTIKQSTKSPSSALDFFSNTATATTSSATLVSESIDHSDDSNTPSRDVSSFALSPSSDSMNIEQLNLESQRPPSSLHLSSPLTPLPRPRGRPRKNALKPLKYYTARKNSFEKKPSKNHDSSISSDLSKIDDKEPSHPMHLRRKSTLSGKISSSNSLKIMHGEGVSLESRVSEKLDNTLRSMNSFLHKKRRKFSTEFHKPEEFQKRSSIEAEKKNLDTSKPIERVRMPSSDISIQDQRYTFNIEKMKDHSENVSTRKFRRKKQTSPTFEIQVDKFGPPSVSNETNNMYIKDDSEETELEDEEHDEDHDEDQEDERDDDDDDDDEEEAGERDRVSQHPIELALEVKPYLYFLNEGYTEVTAKNLKKRVVSDITCIQHDPENKCIWVVFDAQKLYTEFDSATLPIKYWIAKKLNESQAQKEENVLSEGINNLIKEVQTRTLLSRSRLIRSGYRLASDDVTLPTQQQLRKTRSSNSSINTSTSPERRALKRKRLFQGLRDRTRTQLVKVKNNGDQGPYAHVVEPAITPSYLQVMANEFYSTTKRTIIDLQSKYSFLMNICLTLQKENSEMKQLLTSSDFSASSSSSSASLQTPAASNDSVSSLSSSSSSSSISISPSSSLKHSLETSKNSGLSFTDEYLVTSTFE